MTTNPLLPNRHPEADLFILDVGDVVLKDDLASMEHPVFSLSKKPDLTEKIYEHNGNTLEITPSAKGLATIHDKDILIFAISHIIDAKNRGVPYSKDVIFNAQDFLIFSNRYTGGRNYKLLKDALIRLRGTTLTTNIKSNGEEVSEGFGLIDKFRVRKKLDNGTVVSWRITLSDWLFNAIEGNEILTINPKYFRLRKPLERRVYEIARKHCGTKESWKINIELLQKKCGSTSHKRKFRFMLKHIEEHQHLPDYQISIDGDMVDFYRIGQVGKKENSATDTPIPPLKTITYEKFKSWHPRYDVYHIEQEWRFWAQGKEHPKLPDAAFLKWAETYTEKHPL